MKFFKNTLSIILLFTINSIHARTATVASPTIQPQPPVTKITTPPVTQKPAVQLKQMVQPQSYKDLVAYVKNSRDVWDNTQGILKTDFVATMIQKARASHLNALQLEALLQTARDIHGIFSGNQNKDISLLQSVENQITAATRHI